MARRWRPGRSNHLTDQLVAMVEREILGWPGVSKETMEGGQGRGGFFVPPGNVYRFGRKELGHIHVTGVADLTFTRALHDQLVAAGRAESHLAGLPGVVSYYLREEADVPGAIELFRLNYDRAKASAERRGAQPASGAAAE
jgi:hypothetical protein